MEQAILSMIVSMAIVCQSHWVGIVERQAKAQGWQAKLETTGWVAAEYVAASLNPYP